jgi:pyruvate,water dikinase
MLIDLADATPESAGGKAAPLARLLSAGLPVPPAFVVPIRAYEDAIATLSDDAATDGPLAMQPTPSSALVDGIGERLADITGPSGEYVVVRSSATSEDSADSSAAGQHDTVLAVRGADDVADAVRTCWASLWSTRAFEYRTRRRGHLPAGRPAMAVLVQRMVDADVAGVMFTGSTTRIEASWGLGESVVSGRVTPDSWVLSSGHIASVHVGDKATRMDRVGAHVVCREVTADDRHRLSLSDHQVVALERYGRAIEQALGGPQDIEWAVADGQIWVVQARPVTVGLPEARAESGALSLGEGVFATGPARHVRGPSDFSTVQPGDVLVCRTTDPGWTPLFGVIAAVVTETGGLLSHAAIVARELGLPAVLAVSNAMSDLPQNAMVDVDGSNGCVTLMR